MAVVSYCYIVVQAPSSAPAESIRATTGRLMDSRAAFEREGEQALLHSKPHFIRSESEPFGIGMLLPLHELTK